MKSSDTEDCPRCGSRSLKAWADLAEDERFVALRMPASAEYTEHERKKHRICTRCWFEKTADDTTLA